MGRKRKNTKPPPPQSYIRIAFSKPLMDHLARVRELSSEVSDFLIKLRMHEDDAQLKEVIWANVVKASQVFDLLEPEILLAAAIPPYNGEPNEQSEDGPTERSDNDPSL